MNIGQRVKAARLSCTPPMEIEDLARAVGLKPSTLYDLEKGRSRSSTRLHLIARATGCDAYWIETGKGAMRTSNLPALADEGDILIIQKPDAWASMGPGALVQDHVDAVDSVKVRITELRRLTSFSSPDNLRVLTAYGDSMTPTFQDGDVLLIDVGVTDIKVDAVYVLERGDELFVKRVQRRLDGAYIVISDNKLYEPYTVTDAERQQFSIRGRVLMAWNARRL